MKKFSWILALLAVLTMVFIGCGEADDPPIVPGGNLEVIFRLTDFLVPIGVGDYDLNDPGSAADKAKFGPEMAGAFGGSGGNIKVVENGGKLAIKYTTGLDWGQGMDLTSKGLGFKVGDVITATVELVSGTLAQDGFSLNTSGNKMKGDKIAGSGTLYTVLTKSDIDGIYGDDPANVRIKAPGVGVKVRITEITVEREPVATAPESTDYSALGMIQKAGQAVQPTITSKVGSGAPTAVYFTGSDGVKETFSSTKVPATAGKYEITFDVGQVVVDGKVTWLANTNLYAGTLFLVDDFIVNFPDSIDFEPSKSMDGQSAGTFFEFWKDESPAITYKLSAEQQKHVFVKIFYTLEKIFVTDSNDDYIFSREEYNKEMKLTLKSGSGGDLAYLGAPGKELEYEGVIERSVADFGDAIVIAMNTWEDGSSNYSITIDDMVFYSSENQINVTVGGRWQETNIVANGGSFKRVMDKGTNLIPIGYEFTSAAGYGNNYVKFAIDLGTEKLSAYESVTLTWQNVGGESANEEIIFVAGTELKGGFSYPRDSYNWENVSTPGNTTADSRTFNINRLKADANAALTGKIEVAFYTHGEENGHPEWGHLDDGKTAYIITEISFNKATSGLMPDPKTPLAGHFNNEYNGLCDGTSKIGNFIGIRPGYSNVGGTAEEIPASNIWYGASATAAVNAKPTTPGATGNVYITLDAVPGWKAAKGTNNIDAILVGTYEIPAVVTPPVITPITAVGIDAAGYKLDTKAGALTVVASAVGYTMGAVTWLPSETAANFQPNKIYIADIVINASSGYEFASAAAITVTGGSGISSPKILSKTVAAGKVTLKVQFDYILEPVLVTDLVAITLAAPDVDEKPAGATLATSSKYGIGTTTWTGDLDTTTGKEGQFKTGVAYEAKFVLTAAAGYTFNQVGTAAAISDADIKAKIAPSLAATDTVSIVKATNGTTITVTVKFTAITAP